MMQIMASLLDRMGSLGREEHDYGIRDGNKVKRYGKVGWRQVKKEADSGTMKLK